MKEEGKIEAATNDREEKKKKKERNKLNNSWERKTRTSSIFARVQFRFSSSSSISHIRVCVYVCDSFSSKVCRGICGNDERERQRENEFVRKQFHVKQQLINRRVLHRINNKRPATTTINADTY